MLVLTSWLQNTNDVQILILCYWFPIVHELVIGGVVELSRQLGRRCVVVASEVFLGTGENYSIIFFWDWVLF